MNSILNLGKYLLAIPILTFGVFHFLEADGMSQMVPAYLGKSPIWVYLSGLGLVGAAVSIIIGKYDKLASVLLAGMLLIFVLTIHLPNTMNSADAQAFSGNVGALLKDIAMAGAALLYAKGFARDSSFIG